MSVDKLVDSAQLDTDLTSVANAIRTKGGTSAQLAFPADFVSAIAAIPSGGGTDYLAYRCNNNAEYSYFSVDVTNLSSGCFRDASNLTSLVLPKLETVQNTNYICAGCTKLSCVDFGMPNRIAGQMFYNDSALNVIVLRAPSVVPLVSQNALNNNTPFASGKAGGTLYVPSSLISSYQSATNWSTILGYANNQIKSIESTHTDPNAPIDLTLYYADGTLIPT